jgi:hypothetical protein
MWKTILAAALAAGLLVTLPPPNLAAQNVRVAEDAAPKAKTKAKPMTPQQQKMKDCSAKWADEKAKTGAKGSAAYRKFMSGCLKQKA